MGSAGTDGMTGLFQVSLGEVKVAGEWRAVERKTIPKTDVAAVQVEAVRGAVLIGSFSCSGLVLIMFCPFFGEIGPLLAFLVPRFC